MSVSVLVELAHSDGGIVAMGGESEKSSAVSEFLTIDNAFEPVVMDASISKTMDFAPHGLSQSRIVRADLDIDEEDSFALFERVREIEAQSGVQIWSDPSIAPLNSGIDCAYQVPKGTHDEVADALRVPQVWQASGSKGDGIIIGILDGGVDGSQFPVTGGWSPDSSMPPGSTPVVWNEHGNMCAFDSLIAAPDASIFDYAIGRSSGVSVLLSSALQAFQHALFEGVHVLSNSWGLYQQNWDPFPPGHPGNYSHNSQHPFNRKVVEAINSGILVCFAAGNCGFSCPSQKCGFDVGPGRSIRGANGAPRVISVGAVNLHDQWIGYSSQGPSTMASDKPDVCGFSHFTGYTNSDSGTSAACPVIAGVLALLKSAEPSLFQDHVQQVLRVTARQTSHASWSQEFGYGIVDALAAFRAL